jgi:hypothetical protein
MKIKITSAGDGRSWYSSHVGEEFLVNTVTVYVRRPGFANYECNLVGRHPGAIAGTISPRHCEVTDWTGWPFAEASA